MESPEKHAATKKRIRNRKIAFACLSLCCAAFVAVVVVHDLAVSIKKSVQEFGEGATKQISKDFEPIGKAIEGISEHMPELEKELNLPEVLDSEGNIITNETNSSISSNTDNTDNAFYPKSQILSAENGIVKQIIDGETFLIEADGETYKVRLIGVDVPESAVLSDYSSNKDYDNMAMVDILGTFISEGEKVNLEYDNSPADKYGRSLAYIYRADGTMAQEWLLENGYAKALNDGENKKYSARFSEIESKAKENNLGFWNGFFSE